jgi:hypothetical protein
MTKVTDLPRLEAVLYSPDIEMYEHMPRKFDSIILLVNIDAKNIINGLMPFVIDLPAPFLSF